MTSLPIDHRRASLARLAAHRKATAMPEEVILLPTKGDVLLIPDLDEAWGDEALFRVKDAQHGICVVLLEDGARPLTQINFDAVEWQIACEGHESLDGAHMGMTVECNGSCRG